MTMPARSPRHRLIAAVHVASTRRGVSDEDRRALMERLTGKRSCADMTARELARVLDAINGRRHSDDPGWQQKARALWISAHQLGLVDDPSDRALDQFVRRQTGIVHLRWLTPQRARAVIEALKAWLGRPVEKGGGGVDWSWPKDATDRKRVAIALFRRLGDLGITIGAPLAVDDYGRRMLGISQRRPLSDDEWARVLPILGARLRKAREGSS